MKSHPGLAGELASIRVPPVRVRVLVRGGWLVPAWLLLTVQALVIVAELFGVWLVSDGIQVHGWSPWWWLAVVAAVLAALADTAVLRDRCTQVHRLRHQKFPPDTGTRETR